MVDERSRCCFCKKGFFVEETGITSGDTAFFCNNCFKYKEEPVKDSGSLTKSFHSTGTYSAEDYWYDGWT